MRKLLVKAALPLAAALVTALVVTYVFYVRPWLAWPDEPVERIERRWQEVRQWALPNGRPVGDEGHALIAAVTKLKRQHGRLTRLFLAQGRESRRIDWQIERDGLPEEVREALALMVRWHRTGRPLPVKSCTEPTPMLGLHILGRLALASAPAVDSPQAKAALAFARSIRGSTSGLAVGLSLARDALDWAAARSASAPHRELLARARPEPVELFAAIATEAVCFVELIGRGGATNADVRPRPAPLLSRLADAAREVAMLKQHYAARLGQLHRHRNHLGRLNAALQLETPLPKSAVVRALARAVEPSWAHLATLMRETIERFDK